MNDGNAIRIQGIRVLWNKAPYKIADFRSAVTNSHHQVAVNMSVLRTRIMRGDYYVVPPNGARIHTCVRTLLRIAPAGAPEGKYWRNIWIG